MSQHAPSHTHNAGHKARRPRAARACDVCRVKKNKCDELYPCTYCRNRNVECVYQGQDVSRGRFTPEYVRGLEEQVRRLTAALDAHKAAAQSSSVVSASPPPLSGLASIATSTTAAASPAAIDAATTAFPPPPSPNRARPPVGREVSAINVHTRHLEFYGSSSSLAMLSHAQGDGGDDDDDDDPDARNDDATPRGPGHSESDAAAAALLSSLHNPAFSPPHMDVSVNGQPAAAAAASSPRGDPQQKQHQRQHQHQHQQHQQQQRQASVMESTHYRQCSVFLHNFFSTIHYVHPILDKTYFLERCEILWSGDEAAIKQHASFVPLYYSVLSLGALVGYRDAEPVGGISNQKWSRKFFIEARARFPELELMTDLEMVQCYFFLAKVCQNELNSHWSYFYTGLAVRTSLAMGINRQPSPHSKKSPALLKGESRTWWALYSLEEELSFAMGRPSSLGVDEYHNRDFPYTELSDIRDGNMAHLDTPHCTMIRHMVAFSRITRHVCVKVYLTNNPPARAVEIAQQLDYVLDEWLASLPDNIRPGHASGQVSVLGSSKEAIWMKRQRLVLTIRYLNLRILLFGSFLLNSTYAERSAIPGSYEGVQKCLDAAKKTIEIIYETYKHHEFFRTWFYNTTYTIFAASIIMVYINQEASDVEIQPLTNLVAMAIDVLDTMANECVVAGKAAQFLQRTLNRSVGLRARRKQQQQQQQCVMPPIMPPVAPPPPPPSAAAAAAVAPEQQEMMWADSSQGVDWMHLWAPVNLLDGDMMNFDLGMPYMGFEGADMPGPA